MRQIKFRCWDKIKKKYRFDSFLKTGDGRGDWIVFLSDQLQPEMPDKLSFSSNIVYHRERFLLEEFTNIIDINDKEIYEGDIVRDEEYLFLVSFGEYDINRYSDDRVSGLGFYLKCLGNVKYISNVWNPLYLKKTTVLGNRFENQELLKLDD